MSQPEISNAQIVEALRKLKNQDELAEKLFDTLSKKTRDARETPARVMAQWIESTPAKAVQLSKALGSCGVGRFIPGRRGHESRFEWQYGLRGIGLAAINEEEDISLREDDASSEELISNISISETKNFLSLLGAPPDWDLEDVKNTIREKLSPKPTTLSEAKKRLARDFGVPETSIEIFIKI